MNSSKKNLEHCGVEVDGYCKVCNRYTLVCAWCGVCGKCSRRCYYESL